MAIEDDEPKDREVWSGVTRFWYNKASDKSPTIGRLYHHLAVLARPYTLEQLYLYTRSLTCVTTFESAKGSILTLFNPILSGKEPRYRRSNSLETTFIKAYGLLFNRKPSDPFDQFDQCVRRLDDEGLLEKYINEATARFTEIGVYAAVSNIAALFEYGGGPKQGLSKSFFRLNFEEMRLDKDDEKKQILQGKKCPVYGISFNSTRIGLETATTSKFARPEEALGRSLPENFCMRGELYTQQYFPEDWFSAAKIDDDERTLDLPSTVERRLERILWLGFRIAAVCKTCLQLF